MNSISPLQALFDRCGTAELITASTRMSATALHHGANDWSRALRRVGIMRGDRVLCALPNGDAFVQLLIASLADGVTLVPVPVGDDVERMLDIVDARVAIALDSTSAQVAVPSRTGGPPSAPLVPRRSSQRTDTIAFLLRSSGTTAEPRWVAIAERGVLAVLQSHLPLMAIDGASTLCVLPWHHAFGLILGLIPALLRARRVVTSAADPRNTNALIDVLRQHAVTHMSLVPLLASRLSAHADGQHLLEQLAGGIVGGAPIDALLAARLATTRLRVGYGLTEASPGIMLGEPGEFRAGLLGRPVGCAVRIDSDGVLAFTGPNMCDGYWIAGAMHTLNADRWHRTDDLVSVTAGTYSFVGRTSMSFKLANGRMVAAPAIEASVRAQNPRVIDAVLHSRDGVELDLLYSTRDARPIDRDAVELALGGLRQYLRTVTCIGVDAWQRTSKGEIDRLNLPALR
jgi:acyl-CoA synthetase (AMP-forming)/AMP-acid ligase II